MSQSVPERNEPRYTEDGFERKVDPMLRALLARQVAASGSKENPYELFNRLSEEERHTRLYKDGKTKMTATALSLALESFRTTSNSTKLWRNMQAADPNATKADNEDSHHIVAARAIAAAESRKILFNVGIGINDARNGVNYNNKKHCGIHTASYYVKVTMRLFPARYTNEEIVGKELVEIGQDILKGIFC